MNFLLVSRVVLLSIYRMIVAFLLLTFNLLFVFYSWQIHRDVIREHFLENCIQICHTNATFTQKKSDISKVSYSWTVSMISVPFRNWETSCPPGYDCTTSIAASQSHTLNTGIESSPFIAPSKGKDTPCGVPFYLCCRNSIEVRRTWGPTGWGGAGALYKCFRPGWKPWRRRNWFPPSI